MKVNFLGIPIDALTMEETVQRIDNAISTGQNLSHVVLNAGKVVMMQKDRSLFESVISCDLINADGHSIVWAARFLGEKIPERVTGVDLMQALVEMAYKRDYKCYFFGAKEEVVKKMVNIYSEKYGPQIVAGYRNGYYSEEEERSIAENISDNNTNILFVAISSPKKEKFLYNNRDLLKDVNFTMGVGGSFDVISGYIKRAPLWMQRIGMEWFHRFLQEPARMWKRYLIGNFQFLWIILKEKFKK